MGESSDTKHSEPPKPSVNASQELAFARAATSSFDQTSLAQTSFSSRATMRATLAIVVGIAACILLGFLTGSVMGWLLFIGPLVLLYAVFEIFTVSEVASVIEVPAKLWSGVCPGCGYGLPRSGEAFALSIPDAAARRQSPQHERTTRCSECGAAWDLAKAKPLPRNGLYDPNLP